MNAKLQQLNQRYSSADVAAALVRKISLRGQRVAKRRKMTEAEKRRAMQLGRLAMIVAKDRKGF